MSWREFLEKFSDTAGITLLFAALGSGFMLWASANRTPPRIISGQKALMVVASGQLVGTVATAVAYGYLGWSLFTAPALGAVCGIVGLFVIMLTLKVGERVEDRGTDLADRGIDIVAPRRGEKP